MRYTAPDDVELTAAIGRYVNPETGGTQRYMWLLHGNFMAMDTAARAPSSVSWPGPRATRISQTKFRLSVRTPAGPTRIRQAPRRSSPPGSGSAEKAGLPLAAALASVQAGLGSLDDDALAGFLGGCQKIAAWSAGMMMDGIAEFAGRRPDDGTPGRPALHAAAVKKARAAQAAGAPGV